MLVMTSGSSLKVEQEQQRDEQKAAASADECTEESERDSERYQPKVIDERIHSNRLAPWTVYRGYTYPASGMVLG